MCPEVLRETVFELEFHTTLLANVLHLMQLSVTVKIFLGLKALSANLALKLLNLRLVLVMLVEIQGTFAGIRCAAYVANTGFCIVILHMRCIVGLYLEHLAALFAAVVVVLGMLANIMYLQIRFRARFKFAQGARMKLRGLVVNFHMPRKIRTSLEALGADCAFVRTGIAMLEHMTGEFALAIKRNITNLADMRLFFWTSRVFTGSRFREFIFAPFPKVQRSIIQIVQIIQIIDGYLIFLSSLNAFLIFLFRIIFFRFYFIFFRLSFGTIFFDRRRFFHHKHAQ